MPLYTFIHILLNVLVQIPNKMGLQKGIIHKKFLPEGLTVNSGYYLKSPQSFVGDSFSNST
jgi:hypothetical protein